MALKKTIVQRNGVPAEYHRISGIRVAKGGMYEIGVQSFFTEDARNAGSNPVDEQIKFVPADKIESLLAAQYDILKALPEFADAESVYDPEKISLDHSEIILAVGKKAKLTATVLPEVAMKKDITWKSSDEKIVTVTDGKVEAIAVGEATITCTSVVRGRQATCKVKVTEK